MKRACKTCQFSDKIRLDPKAIKKVLICRWGPPQLVTIFQPVQGGGAAPMTAGTMPQVQDADWCYQYRPRMNGDNEGTGGE